MSGQEKQLLGTCIEGVRVEYSAPGFVQAPLYAMANATGVSAPRTNVARSGLESTPESTRLIRRIYDGYCTHVTSEILEMQEKRSMSLTHAVGEAIYLLDPLLRFRGEQGRLTRGFREEEESLRPTDIALLRDALAEVPLL